MNSSTSILFNSPALKSLQRKQLVSLCKRYRLKASGKNSDLINKLQNFAESLPEEALTDPSFSLADHIASRAPPSSDNLEPPTSDASRAGRESEAWEVLDEVAEEVEGGSWKSAENGEGGGEFGTRKATSTSLSKSTAKSFKSFLKRSQHGSLSSSSHSSKRSAAPPIVHSQPEQDESMGVDEDLPPSPHIPSPAPGVARALRPSLAGTEPTIRMVQSSSTSSLASTARGAVSPPRMGNRMLVDSPFCITTSISSSSLYPTLPTKPEEKEDSIPGSFPSASSSSNNTPKRLASPPPFVFGNPRHSISNQQFRSPTIAAASMTAAGLSMREVMEEEMRKRMEEKGLVTAGGAAGLALPSWMVALGQPGGTVAASGVVGAVAGSPMKRRFDDLHEKEFAKMPSIADHYTAKRSINPSSTKSKPTASSSSRAIANGRRPSSLIAAGAPRYRPSLAAQAEGPSSKRVKVSFSATPAQASNLERAGSISSTSKGKEREVQVDTRKEEDAEMEREKEAIKRKLAMSKARRSSVAGRRLSGGKAKPAPKGAPSRFGFLHHGVEAMRKGVASFLPTTKSATLAGPAYSSAAAPSSTSNFIPKSSSIPKLSSLLASSQKEKEKTLAKPEVVPASKKEKDSSSRKFFGGAKKINMAAPPPPAPSAFKPSRLNAIPASSSVSSSSSSRPAIPSFHSNGSMGPPTSTKFISNRLSTVSSASSSRAPSTSVRDRSSVSSRPGSTSVNRTTVAMVSSRPGSSLLAPTASFLARQQANGRNAHPIPTSVPIIAPTVPASTKASTSIYPPLPPAVTYPSTSTSNHHQQQQQRPRITSEAARIVPKKSLTHFSAAASALAPPPPPSFPSLSSVQPLFPSLAATTNFLPLHAPPPPPTTTPSKAAPAPYRPAFKARVASKVSSTSSFSTTATPKKKRSSVSTSLLSKPGGEAGPSRRVVVASGSSLREGGGGGNKGRKSVPSAGFMKGGRRETIVGKEKGRGRRSEGGLGRGRKVGTGMSGMTPRKGGNQEGLRRVWEE